MKKVFLVLLACVIAVGVQAQSKNNSNGDKGSANQSDPNRIYEFAEDMPEFIGGLKAYEKWLKEHGNHLDESGRCVVQFVVERDGSISNAKIYKSGSSTINAEALRLVNAMPKWKPGKVDGKPARIRYTLPFVYVYR